MTTQSYTVDGMTCAHCAQSVTTAVTELAGVEQVVVDLSTNTVAVTADVQPDTAVLAAAVSEAGYTLTAGS